MTDRAAPPVPSPLVAGALLGCEDNGLAAEESRAWGYVVAPTEGDNGNSTLAVPLRVRASFRLDGVRFARSFVEPGAAPEIRMLVALLERCPECPISIFGHSDPVGSDEENKTLSGRRARAVYALLVRDVDAWDELHQSAVHGDRWGLESLQSMLAHLGYEPGPPTGRMSEPSRRAVESFQTDRGLEANGRIDRGTRRALIERYMDALCADAHDEPVVVARERFLGGDGDAGGKAAYQGCGELNLRRRPSRDQEREHANDRAARDAFHAENRRVTVLLFEPGTNIAAETWPCPRASEGLAGCRKRLWSDEKTRGSAADAERVFWIDRDTFRCRFYHRLHLRTVAEGVGPPQAVSITLRDHYGHPAAGVAVLLGVGTVTRALTSDAAGRIVSSMPAGAVTMTIQNALLDTDDQYPFYANDDVAALQQDPELPELKEHGSAEDDGADAHLVDLGALLDSLFGEDLGA